MEIAVKLYTLADVKRKTYILYVKTLTRLERVIETVFPYRRNITFGHVKILQALSMKYFMKEICPPVICTILLIDLENNIVVYKYSSIWVTVMPM